MICAQIFLDVFKLKFYLVKVGRLKRNLMIVDLVLRVPVKLIDQGLVKVRDLLASMDKMLLQFSNTDRLLPNVFLD